MKIVLTIAACCLFTVLNAQGYIKPPSAGIHYSLTDFTTAEQIKSTSLSNVLKNKLWSKPPQMMTGFGIDFLTGVTKHIDFAASVNYTNGINAFNLPSTNLNSYSLFTADALLNIKLVSDKYYIRPFIVAGAGVYFQNGSGMYAPLGTGLQFNIFDAAIVNVQTMYRAAFKKTDNPNLFYQIGFATALGKKKVPAPKPVLPPPPPLPEPAPKPAPVAEIKPIFKDIAVTVYDEATMQPLQYVEVSLTGDDGSQSIIATNADGKAVFNNIHAGGYTVTGRLNKIGATTATLAKESFDSSRNPITATLTHNDPRFTLVGHAVDKTAGKPVGNTTITITNSSQNSVAFASSNEKDGEFHTQLESGSDFVVVGKKASYISNIEHISTKGLNRSATLYVKLELGIEEAKAGQAIVLNNIYFETGKATLNTNASGDLDKLNQFLKDNPQTKLEIAGYTDNVGSFAANNTLSQGRANSVVAYLVNNGIEASRLAATGLGPANPVASNATTEGRARNRRVEMKVVE